MGKKTLCKPPAAVPLGEFLLDESRFPAVYFLYDNGIVVYVGQSRTLRWRIETHLNEGVKVFDAVGHIRCTLDQLAKLEGRYIRHLAPRYNACGIAKKSREEMAWAPQLRARKPRWSATKKAEAKAA